MAKRDKHVLTIIGGGQSAYNMLISLYTDVTPAMLPLEVIVLEKGEEVAGGIAWSAGSARPFHYLNTYVPLNIRASIEEVIARDPDAPAQHISPMGEVSRTAAGMLFKDRMGSIGEALQTKGIDCKILPGRDTVDVRQNGDRFEIHGSDGLIRLSDFVLLATGHWQHTDESKSAAVYPSPWPASRIEKIPSNQPIAVLGSSLSGVDACLTLAHKAGSFTRDERGQMVFEPADDAPNFKVACYSRTGMLPSVLSLNPFENESSLFPLVADRLDVVFALFCTDLAEYIETHPSSNSQMQEIWKVISDPATTLESAAKAFMDFYREENKDPAERLGREIDTALTRINNREVCWWQDVLRSSAQQLDSLFQTMSAEEQTRFMEHIYPIYSKLAYGMVIDNAEKIHAMMNAGCLEVKTLGQSYALATKGDKVELHYNDDQGKPKVDSFNALVRATGDEPGKLRHSSPLMRNLFASGMASEMIAPYLDQQQGRKEYEAQQTAPEKGNVRLIDGRYYRGGGTLNVDPETMELIPAEGNRAIPGLFAIGPPLMSRTPLVQGVNTISIASHAIMRAISDRLRSKRREVLYADSKNEFGIGMDAIDLNSLGLGAIASTSQPLPPDLMAIMTKRMAEILGVSPDLIEMIQELGPDRMPMFGLRLKNDRDSGNKR